MNLYEQKAGDGLLELRMDGAAQALDSLCQMAAAENWSYSHFLGKLLEAETSLRMKKKVAMAYQLARFPYKRTLTDFDFEAQAGVDKTLVEELATGRYLSEGSNPIFLGPPGVGKTHLAVALGSLLCDNGQRAYFTTAVDMVRKLSGAVNENRLHRALQTYIRPSLLIIDKW